MALTESGGSCSPHGWASCLLERLEEFQSGALSAGAGLYLRHPGQGAYKSNASETLSMAKYTDVCVCVFYGQVTEKTPFCTMFQARTGHECEYHDCNVMQDKRQDVQRKHTSRTITGVK